MLSVRNGATAGLVGQVALLAGLATTVGLTGVGWVVGLMCGALTTAGAARGLARSGDAAMAPADLVTLTRATLTGGAAALVADSFLGAPAVTALVALAVVALVSDAVDGSVARRTRTSSFGGRFDGEVDALLILVLSVYVARSFGWWVLAIGAMRYAFAVAGWAMPWLRRPLPFRYWRKVVTATQGIVLTVAAADVTPRWSTYVALGVALAMLAESFGRDVLWLWRHRSAEVLEPAEPADVGAGPRGDLPVHRPTSPGRTRTSVAVVANTLALLLVWFAFVAPNQVERITPGALLRIPVEGLALVFLALVLPPAARRAMAVVVGVVLGLLTVVKVLDWGFFVALDRPFDPVGDLGYLAPAVDLLKDSIGPWAAGIAVVAAAALLLGVLAGVPLSVRRLTELAARHQRRAVLIVTGLAVVWIPCAAFGLQLGQDAPIASTSASRLAVGQVRSIVAGVGDEQRFDAATAHDPARESADTGLLAGLRGKDVVVVFVESYGRVATEGSPSSPQVQAVLDDGTSRLQARGYSSRSAFLTSPTFGGLSWLAHATLQSGLWVDSERRHDQLLASNRMTLSSAFKEAGWRTVAVMASNDEAWPEGERFYDFHDIHDGRDIEYQGPRFGWSTMPDQYVLRAFQRLELTEHARTPVMAEISLSSSHAPWAPLPRMVAWTRLGDGSIYDRIHSRGQSAQELWRDLDDVEAAYSKSIAYSLSAVISFVEKYGDDDLVLILVGDHQPSTAVSGHGASHDVPITVVARDPAVMDRISGWGWQDGMRPDSQAPVWRMDAFRDRFLAAFSSDPSVVRQSAPRGRP